jgi:hypothetical protein
VSPSPQRKIGDGKAIAGLWEGVVVKKQDVIPIFSELVHFEPMSPKLPVQKTDALTIMTETLAPAVGSEHFAQVFLHLVDNVQLTR